MTLMRMVTGPRAAVAVVPLALLTASWTVGITGAGTSLASSEQSPDPAPRASGEPAEPVTEVPTEALEAPATVSDTTPEATDEKAAKKLAEKETVRGIPTPALSAYRRAETIMNAADESCRVDWQLLAAVGRVESNHGRYGGNVLNDEGLATPGIYGIALDGTRGTRMIADTDGGQYDNDRAWDRAVGPMQFIPSTWSVVAVDSDGDGERNPQDIDDAVLGAAVYLCAGDEDLSTEGGRKDAIFRYNNSDAYVQLVLAIHAAYLEGDYSSLPETSYAGSGVIPTGAPFQSAPGGTAARSAGFPDPGNASDPGHAADLTPESAGTAGHDGRPSPTEPRPQQVSEDDNGKDPQGNGGRGPKGDNVLVEEEPTLPPKEPKPPKSPESDEPEVTEPAEAEETKTPEAEGTKAPEENVTTTVPATPTEPVEEPAPPAEEPAPPAEEPAPPVEEPKTPEPEPAVTPTATATPPEEPVEEPTEPVEESALPEDEVDPAAEGVKDEDDPDAQ